MTPTHNKRALSCTTLAINVLNPNLNLTSNPKPGVAKLGYMYPLGYICLSEEVNLRLATEGKNMFTYYSFLNDCTYISEYYFKSHYMLIVHYIFVVFLNLFVLRNFRGIC